MEIPQYVADDEPLHRRVSPTFWKPDGTISSAAFTDPEMSVDRARYRCIEETMQNHGGCGLARVVTSVCRGLGQAVDSEPELLNAAHALVKGKKTQSIRKALARKSEWMVPLPTAQHAMDERLEARRIAAADAAAEENAPPAPGEDAAADGGS